MCIRDRGIDIGGSGVKGAPVDLDAGDWAAERLKIETPQPATPEAVIEVVAQIAEHFADATGDSPVGVTIPGIVRHGVVGSAANIDPSWIGTDAQAALTEHLGRPVSVLNDADAAGVAELHYGAAKDTPGAVSYTHLDVYKRQASRSTRRCCDTADWVTGSASVNSRTVRSRVCSSSSTRRRVGSPSASKAMLALVTTND